MKKSVKSANAVVDAKVQIKVSDLKTKPLIRVMTRKESEQFVAKFVPKPVVEKVVEKPKPVVTNKPVSKKVVVEKPKLVTKAAAIQMPLPKVPEHRSPGRIAGVIPMSVTIKKFFSTRLGSTVDECVKVVSKQYGGCRRAHVVGVLRDAEHKFGWKRIENSGMIRLLVSAK